MQPAATGNLGGTLTPSTTPAHLRSFAVAADTVVVVHALFVAFLVAGGFIAWKWPGAAPLHLAALVISSAIYLGGFDCPLTNLEKFFRTRAGETVYTDGFIAHYIVNPLYPGGMTAALGIALVVLVVGAALLAYGRHLVWPA